MKAIRILIADDHPVFRFGMRALLNAMPDTEVVGEVTTGEEVIGSVPSPMVRQSSVRESPSASSITSQPHPLQRMPQVSRLGCYSFPT